MKLQEIAKNLGLEEYPEEMNLYFPIPEERKSELCTKDMIDTLQEKFNLFGPFSEQMHLAFDEVQKDPDQKIWLDTTSLFIKDCDLKNARKVPFPPMKESASSGLLPVLAHLPSIENTYQGYRKRGFTHEQAITNMEGYKVNMAIVAEQTGGLPGIHGYLCKWICNYTKGIMIRHGCLNYELRTLPKDTPFILKNKTTGEILPVSNNLPIHRSGLMLGSAGAEDEEGSFSATWEETDDAYLGYPIKDFRFSKQKESFSKTDWELIAKPGDRCVAVHIPKKTDFSPEAVIASLNGMKELLPRQYPEYKANIFYTATWLLCPDLEELLRPSSNILAFGRRFVRFPKIDNGQSVFSLVFNNNCGGDYKKLPEDNSLRRAMKQKYLNGEVILKYAGVIPF